MDNAGCWCGCCSVSKAKLAATQPQAAAPLSGTPAPGTNVGWVTLQPYAGAPVITDSGELIANLSISDIR